MAEWTGLEPATSGLTGRRSNQLNYHSMWSDFPKHYMLRWAKQGSNLRPAACKAEALPLSYSPSGTQGTQPFYTLHSEDCVAVFPSNEGAHYEDIGSLSTTLGTLFALF